MAPFYDPSPNATSQQPPIIAPIHRLQHFSSPASSTRTPRQHSSRPRDTVFTSSMRDAQSRGKETQQSSESEGYRDERSQQVRKYRGNGIARPDTDGDDLLNQPVQLGRQIKTTVFEDDEQRGFAASVLDNPERLLMYAQSRDDSAAGQRYRFTAQLCGFWKKGEETRPACLQRRLPERDRRDHSGSEDSR